MSLVFRDQRLDPGGLRDAVLLHAGALRKAGLAAGDTLALLLRNDAWLPLLSLAAAKVGVTVVPINWHFAPAEVAYVLDDCQARLLLGHSDLLAPLAAHRNPRARTLALSPSDEPKPFEAGGFDRWTEFAASCEAYAGPELPAAPSMLYTSGTTGRPKGVRRPPLDATQRKRVAACMDQVFDGCDGMRTLAVAPLYHGAPNAVALFTLRRNGSLIVEPGFEAERVLELIDREQITHVFMVPTMFVRLLALPVATRRRYSLASLRCVIHGAAPCPPHVKREMIEWLGNRIVDYYGATELGPVTRVTATEWLQHPGTVGKAVPGVKLRILDEHGAELPANTVGEVYARNTAYPDFTYHGQDEQRRLAGRDGLVSCGDLGHLDPEGYLYINDRKRDMVISGGVNIYPAEIEMALAAVEGVADSAVFGIPDSEFGEAVCAHVVLRAGTSMDAEQLRGFLRPVIAGYKIPRRIEFCGSLPREPSGKLMKRRLRDAYLAVQPQTDPLCPSERPHVED